MADYTTWTDALYSLDDDSFLSIMRNYLGPIKTPFNKQGLIKQLTTFLSQDKIREKILSLINEQERSVLNAIYFLKSPSVDDIYQFFGKNIQFYIIQQTIINLEERLLVLQNSDRSLMINILFLSDLLGSHIHISHIIYLQEEITESSEALPPTTMLDQPLFISFLSLFTGNYIRTTNEGNLKRSTLRILDDIFTQTDSERVISMTHLTIRSFLHCGIISSQNGILSCDTAFTDELLSTHSWSQIFFKYLVGCFTQVYRSVTEQNLYSFLYELLSILLQIGPLQPSSLHRFWLILSSHHGIPLQEMHEPLNILLNLGILNYCGNTYKLNFHLASVLDDNDDEKKENCVIDSDYTITSNRNFTLRSSKFLYACTRIRHIDAHYQFEITKNSAVQAFDSGYSSEQIIELLHTISSTQIPHNIIQTISQWKLEYDSLQIYSGIIIAADTHRSRIIEKHPALQDHMIRRFTEGVYLFKSDTEAIWREILSQSGFDVIPKTKNSIGQVMISKSSAEPYIRPNTKAHVQFSAEVIGSHIPEAPYDESLKKEMTDILMKMPIPKRSAEELEARIDKGLILVKEQLVSTHLHPTVQEAHGFDFQGKLNLCKQAMESSKDLLELHLKSFPDDEKVILIRPTELKKQGNEIILIGLEVPENHQFEKSLRKIFLLRKLKSSLYTPLS